MNSKKLAITLVVALSVMSLGAEAFAVGGGGGLRKRDGSCVTNTTQTPRQVRSGNSAGSKTTTQGQRRRLGPGDGTGNVTPPQDGTGYGSPATSQTSK